MIDRLRDSKFRRRMHYTAVIGAGALFLGAFVASIPWHQQRWIDNCISDTAGRPTPPDDETRKLIATSIKARYPIAEGKTFEGLVEADFKIEQKRWDFAQTYCPSEARRRALAF